MIKEQYILCSLGKIHIMAWSQWCRVKEVVPQNYPTLTAAPFFMSG